MKASTFNSFPFKPWKNKTGFCGSYFYELSWVHKITHRYFINQKISHSGEEVNRFLGDGKSLSQQCVLIMDKLGWYSHLSFRSSLNRRHPMRQSFPVFCLCPVYSWKNLHSSGPQATVSAATLVSPEEFKQFKRTCNSLSSCILSLLGQPNSGPLCEVVKISKRFLGGTASCPSCSLPSTVSSMTRTQWIRMVTSL